MLFEVFTSTRPAREESARPNQESGASARTSGVASRLRRTSLGKGLSAGLLAVGLLQVPAIAQADYVGSLTNRVFLDPASIPELLDGYDNGDEIAYILETTPRDTGSDFGIAAWATVYIPPGVEVIGADFVEPGIGGNFLSQPAEITDDSYDGYGSRGSKNYTPNAGATQLDDGRVTEVNQDTGIFYSNDPRTQGQLTEILPALTPTGPQTKPAEIFNQWDYDQVKAFGTNSALSGNKGTGNTPLVSTDTGATWKGTGSAVAGPDTFYTNDYNPACDCNGGCPASALFQSDVQCTGPWNRIATPGSRLANNTVLAPTAVTGAITNTSVLTGAGVTLNDANPLPSNTNAVRFVHGARRLGELEYSRVKFRITNVSAFLASLNTDSFCLESTGGDTSSTAAKDCPWRYYEPEHKCFQELGGPGENGVLLKQVEFVNGCPSSGDFLKAGDVIGWDITFTNTSGGDLTNLSITDAPDAFLTLIEPGANALCPYADYNGDLPGPGYSAGSATGGTATWGVISTLPAGGSVTVHLCGVVAGNAKTGDVVSNTATIGFSLPDQSTDEETSTSSGTVAGGLLDGRVLLDSDGDGDLLDVDAGIAGATTKLFADNNSDGKVDGGDTQLASIVSLSDGSYSYEGLPVGKYVIQEIDPNGLVSTADADTTAGNCNTGNGCNEIARTLTAGSSSRCNNFLDAPPCGNGVIDQGEDCDEGENNGLEGFCCTVDCTFVPGGTTCRESDGVCDPEETCTGSSGDCPSDTFDPSSTVCRGSAGVCDVAENCTGSTADCPADAKQSSATTCRGSAGVCDTAEQCDGSSAGCPADAFVSSANTCRGSAGVCDVAELCTGSSAGCPGDGFVSSSSVCRGSAGVCDVAENCTGSAAACPSDTLVSSNTTCRGSAGVCDVAELCTGSSAGCPGDALLNSTTTCRASGGVCDIAEVCNGQEADCPTDAFVSSGNTCRGSAGVCDVAEVCTGSAAACPGDGFVSSATTCRGSAGVCDVAENCTGSAAACPSDTLVSSNTTCRGSNGVCDAAENCTGTDADCPADVLASSATTCRGSAGVCDVAESCTGSTAECPGDGFVSSATTCRGSAGVCDVAEVCTGSTAACPVNAFVSTATTCRGSAGVCDVAETCSGSAAACPADAFVSTATTCRGSAGVCDVAEKCTGSAASCPADALLNSNTTCRASAGVCDVAEVCNGSSTSCPANGFQSQGTTCTTDNNVCTNDVCNGSGTCTHPNNQVSCDDGAFCTVNDTCSNGTCSGSARNCGDEVSCSVDSCNEQTDSCQHVPNNQACGDEDSCTTDTCNVNTGCQHVFSCKDICRPASFYGKHSGNENDKDNLTQEILDAVGGLEVCGQSITTTSYDESPYVEGLGLSSALEGLCVRPQHIEERPLYQQLVTAALNCAISGTDDCDSVVERFTDVSFSDCDALCSGAISLSEGDYESAIEQCSHELACYNGGGKMINGKCAYGECDVNGDLCGADYGPCPPIGVITFPILQTCERFSGNCRNEDFCQPGLEICPERTPASSSRACKEAKNNDCTIDDCPDFD